MNLTRRFHGNNTGVVSNVEFNSVAPENVKTNLPSIQNGGQKLKGRSRSEEMWFPEDDFKRQTATAADAAVHFKSYYCKEKVNS